MEVLQIIQGREAVPVRAIPFLTGWTGWKTMPPIAIAKALAGTDDQGDFAGLTAYKLRADGSIKKTLQQEWLMVAKDLKGIRATTLKDSQTSHDAWHHAWSKQAIPILPAGVFVWRDEFAEQHASSYFSLRRIDFETGGYSTKKPPELAFDIEVRPPWDSLVLEGFAPAKVPPQAQQSPQETPAPEPAPAAPPEADSGIDYSLLATPQQLIEAFGRFTGMDAAWFDKWADYPVLNNANKVKGTSGRGRTTEPLFCPFLVMQGLMKKPRKGSNRKEFLTDSKPWELLKRHFPNVYAIHQGLSPLDD